MQLIAKIQTYYHEIAEHIRSQYTNVEEQEQLARRLSSFLQLEKVKMLHFGGEPRHYPQFKRDFNKSGHNFVQGMPLMCYALVLEKNPKA